MTLNEEHAAIVKGLLERGEKQHDIAAFPGVNAGRIAEIKTGQRFSDVKPAPRRTLPAAAMMANGHASFVAWQALEITEIAVRSARERILAMHLVSGACNECGGHAVWHSRGNACGVDRGRRAAG